MSCVTCEITPPPEKTSPDRVHDGHIGVRFGDGGLGLAVLYRGHDVTLQCVEAVAGDEDTGWVEMRIVNGSGEPTIHHAADPICPACAGPREPEEIVAGFTAWKACDHCGYTNRPDVAYGPHVVTVIRRGLTHIARGAHLILGPQPEPTGA